jgi:hypothetical protein
MCCDGTYGQSAFHGGGATTDVMYGKSVIYAKNVIYDWKQSLVLSSTSQPHCAKCKMRPVASPSYISNCVTYGYAGIDANSVI